MSLKGAGCIIYLTPSGVYWGLLQVALVGVLARGFPHTLRVKRVVVVALLYCP